MTTTEPLWNVTVDMAVGGDSEQLAREHVEQLIHDAGLDHLAQITYVQPRNGAAAATLIHKARPMQLDDQSECAVCGEPVRKVPGGQGPTWVHEDTGTVVGSGGER